MMRRTSMTALLLLAMAASASLAPPARAAMQTATGISAGVNGGLGVEASVTAYDIAEGFPFSVRAGASLLSLDAGDAALARQVFVNNATNGSPEKAAHRWDLRLDLRHQIRGSRFHGAWGYFGPRLSLFRATYDFAGGNETFDVTTNQWGFGAGIETLYPMGAAVDLSVSAGLDGYANADFIGHDSTYDPSGANVNAKETFGYAAADQAVNQPRLSPRLMVGITRRLGR
jgi:hypothetical protein